MLPMWYMGEDRLARWDKFSVPAVRPVYSLGFDTGGMTSIKPPDCPLSGDKESSWVPI